MSSRTVLSEDLLERCAQRAADYDRENRFFMEDFEELRQANYLLAAVTKEFGELGLTHIEVCHEQRRLARRSAPTALGINMHLLTTGIAADLWRKDDKSQAWLLEEAASGAVFAYGYSESGNDLEALYSAAKAERVDGGYRFFGHKHFGTLTPVWTWLNIYGADTAGPEGPKIVHAVMPRATAGYRIVETWDTLGMRATASQDNIVEGGDLGFGSRMSSCLTFVSTALLPKRFPYVVARIHSCITILYCYLTGLIKTSTRVDGGWFRCGAAAYARSPENTALSLA
jgi:alkylation response protein AidB-like acyl-CoA dehydrogenase